MDAWESDYLSPVLARAELGVLFSRTRRIFTWRRPDGTRRHSEFSMDRWYVSGADDCLKSVSCHLTKMIIGGMHESTPFYNTDPVNSIEFFPPKDGGVPRPSAFLQRSLPANLFPRYVWSLPLILLPYLFLF